MLQDETQVQALQLLGGDYIKGTWLHGWSSTLRQAQLRTACRDPPVLTLDQSCSLHLQIQGRCQRVHVPED
jgi:hypothetical protein